MLLGYFYTFLSSKYQNKNNSEARWRLAARQQ
jgi:hypothetical protein